MKTCKPVLWVVLLTISLFQACDEPAGIPPDRSGDPVFRAQLTVDGVPIVIQAGIEGYIQMPETFSDTNRIVTYRSTFTQPECPSGCGPFLRIEFLEGDFEGGPGSGPESVIKPGPVRYYEETSPEPAYLVSASANLHAGDAQSMLWILSNGNTLSDSVMEVNVTSTDPLQLCVKSQGNPVCNYSQCILVPSAQTLVPCVTNLDIQVVSANLVKITAIPDGTPPYSYSWSTGEIKRSIFHKIRNSVVQYSLLVRDGSGSTNVIEHRFPVVNGVAEQCQLPLDLNVEQQPILKEFQFSTVKVIYMTEEGVEYTSYYGPQEVSTFGIETVADYTDISVTGAFKRLGVRFQCTLYSATGASLQITQGEAEIAVEVD